MILNYSMSILIYLSLQDINKKLGKSWFFNEKIMKIIRKIYYVKRKLSENYIEFKFNCNIVLKLNLNIIKNHPV